MQHKLMQAELVTNRTFQRVLFIAQKRVNVKLPSQLGDDLGTEM